MSAAASGDKERGPVESQAELRSLGHHRPGTHSSPAATGPPADYFQLLPIQHLGRTEQGAGVGGSEQEQKSTGQRCVAGEIW